MVREGRAIRARLDRSAEEAEVAQGNERRRKAWNGKKRGDAARCRVTGKIRYPDARAARDKLRGAVHARIRGEMSGVESTRHESSSYLCDWCDGWHLTSQTKRESRSAKAWRAFAGEPVQIDTDADDSADLSRWAS